MALFFFAQVLFSLDQICWSRFDQTYGPHPQLAYLAVPFQTIWGPTLYLYIKSEIAGKFRFKRRYLLHYFPFLLSATYFLLTYHIQSTSEKSVLLTNTAFYGIAFWKSFGAGVAIQVFVYNIATILVLERFASAVSHGKPLVRKHFRWNRFIVYGYFFTCIANNVASIAYPPSSVADGSPYSYISVTLFLLFFSVILVGALFGSHFGNTRSIPKAKSLTEDEYLTLASSLELYMASEKPFLEFNLSLADLAALLGVKERPLSEYINTYCHTTFQDYVNQYRIGEAQQLIKESVESRKTMLEIAYESGFNSKSAFNLAFKKHTYTTPTGFRKQLLATEASRFRKPKITA